eukprot:9395855-Pyramimonas_sp.AAC.1
MTSDSWGFLGQVSQESDQSYRAHCNFGQWIGWGIDLRAGSRQAEQTTVLAMGSATPTTSGARGMPAQFDYPSSQASAISR